MSRSAYVVGDPVKRFGFLYRAPIIEWDTKRIVTWGGWSRDPMRAEVRAGVILRILRAHGR